MRINRVVEGLTVVAVGLILLGNATGTVSWTVWVSVLSLWPLLIIAAGIDIIGKATDTVWLRVLSSVLILGGLLYGALVLPIRPLSLGFPGFSRASESFSMEVPDEPDVSRGTATISGGAGRFSVTDGRDLVTLDGETPYGEPDLEVDQQGDEVEIDVSLGEGRAFFGSGDAQLDVALSDRVLWDLVVDSGASDLRADLAGLRLNSLQVRTGVSVAKVTLGDVVREARDVSVSVKSGISGIVIRVPKTAEAAVYSDSGLANVAVAQGFAKRDGRYETAGYDEARRRYTIRIESGVTNVEIERY